MTILSVATLGVLALYLMLFFLASGWAAQAASRSVWLFGRATGKDYLAALGFRAAFALTLLEPLLQALVPDLTPIDLLRAGPMSPHLGLLGHVLSDLGAMLAWAGQIGMGTSWRIGVEEGALGELVTEGLHRVSCNPIFAGQLLLLAGVALAVASVPTALAVILFWLSVRVQIWTEEALLERRHGEVYHAYRARVPRWIGWERSSHMRHRRLWTAS